ncbi:MAG: C-GCAxxG-C-C family protein [Christensenellales bacterium]
MTKADYALDCFSKGFSCAQAVFSAFCADLGLDTKLGLKIAGSFGGGMGHSGEACGAFTGALLVLGLKYGQSNEEDKHLKAMNYQRVNEFAARFKERNGSVNCTTLLGYDLSDEKQLNAAREAGVFKTKCRKYVCDAVDILEKMLAEQA